MPADDIKIILYRLDEMTTILENGVLALKDHGKEDEGRFRQLESWQKFIMGSLSVITGCVIPLTVYIWVTHK